jgi:hypothetical protein
LKEVDEERKDKQSLDQTSVNQSRSRQMLPVLCLCQQFPASLRLTRSSLSAKQRHCAKAAGSFHSNLHVFPKHIFQFCDGVIMIIEDNQICRLAAAN